MAFHQNSKADTVFFGDDTLGDLFEDQSQFSSNLTDNTTYLSSTDDRFAITSPRELALVVELTTADSGILLYYGANGGASFTYKIQVVSSTIRFYHNSSGTPLATIAPWGLSATERTYVIHWSTCPDYVGGTYLSEFAVYDVTSGTWSIARATHSAPTVDLSHSLGVGATGNGSAPFSGTVSDIRKVRIGRRFHSTTEAREDWVALSSAPTPSGDYVEPDHCPHMADPYSSTNSEDVGEAIGNNYAFAGPALWLGGLHSNKNRHRLFSPIVNQVSVPDPVTLNHFAQPVERYGSAPDGSGYLVTIYYLWRRPIPIDRGIYARCRAHVQTYLEMGYPIGSTVSISFRMYSMDRLPHEPGCKWSKSSTVTRTTDDGASGTGAWIDMGDLLLQRCKDNSDHTYLALAFYVTPSIGDDYNWAKVKAVTVEPIAPAQQ